MHRSSWSAPAAATKLMPKNEELVRKEEYYQEDDYRKQEEIGKKRKLQELENCTLKSEERLFALPGTCPGHRDGQTSPVMSATSSPCPGGTGTPSPSSGAAWRPCTPLRGRRRLQTPYKLFSEILTNKTLCAAQHRCRTANELMREDDGSSDKGNCASNEKVRNKLEHQETLQGENSADPS